MEVAYGLPTVMRTPPSHRLGTTQSPAGATDDGHQTSTFELPFGHPSVRFPSEGLRCELVGDLCLAGRMVAAHDGWEMVVWKAVCVNEFRHQPCCMIRSCQSPRYQTGFQVVVFQTTKSQLANTPMLLSNLASHARKKPKNAHQRMPSSQPCHRAIYRQIVYLRADVRY